MKEAMVGPQRRQWEQAGHTTAVSRAVRDYLTALGIEKNGWDFSHPKHPSVDGQSYGIE
jgi:hypothetical protein